MTKDKPCVTCRCFKATMDGGWACMNGKSLPIATGTCDSHWPTDPQSAVEARALAAFEAAR